MTKQYTKEFKLSALKLADELGSVAEATKQLGLTPNAIYNWKNKFKYKFSKSEQPKAPVISEAEEIKRLKKNEELKKVNYILKRAAAFFSQDHLK